MYDEAKILCLRNGSINASTVESIIDESIDVVIDDDIDASI